MAYLKTLDLLVNLDPGNDRIGKPASADRRTQPVVRETGAGTDPHAPVRIPPKRFFVGVVPDQPVFRTEMPPGIASRTDTPSALPLHKCPRHVETVEGSDLLDRFSTSCRRPFSSVASLELHPLDSGVQAVVQPKSAVGRENRDVWVVALEPVRFAVLAPAPFAQPPQAVGVGEHMAPCLSSAKAQATCPSDAGCSTRRKRLKRTAGR